MTSKFSVLIHAYGCGQTLALHVCIWSTVLVGAVRSWGLWITTVQVNITDTLHEQTEPSKHERWHPETSLIELVRVRFTNKFWMNGWIPLMQAVLVNHTRRVAATFHNEASPAKWIISLFSPLFLLRMFAWLLILYAVHVFHLKERKEKKGQGYPANFTFSFPSCGFCLVLSSSAVPWLSKPAAGFGDESRLFDCFQRLAQLWMSLVLQSRFFFYPHFMANMEVTIKRIWTMGEAPICLLYRRQQCRHRTTCGLVNSTERTYLDLKMS